MIPAAFYAPMKSPDHTVPSGDRAMARALLKALSAAGISADMPSTFQSRDGAGSAARQAALIETAKTEVARIIPKGREAGWRLWISYHNYYKAPDLLGPKVATALGIPYLLIEATRARKRLEGPWDAFARAAEAATDAAQVVFYLTARDAEALRAYAPPAQKLVHLRPFLPQENLPDRTTGSVDLLAVGMFRAGDKTASYQIIADTLARVQHDWRLQIAGDGPERATVKKMMQHLPGEVSFLGALDHEAMQAAYGRGRILFWPGVNEAFGMAYLEAQAAGMTVLAQDRPGVCDVLYGGASYPSPGAGSEALARRLEMLLAMPKLVSHLGECARKHVAQNHLLHPAQQVLRHTIDEVLP